MNLAAIITGDMVASKTLSTIERDRFIYTVSTLEKFLDADSCTQAEIFRGDSFQLKIPNPFNALKAAVIIRALFRSQSHPKSNSQWDCRISLGIGKTEFEKSTPGLSDGEAYRLSGYGLDGMKRERLTISTPWHEINEDMAVITPFADDIISHWTVKQSEVMLVKLQNNLSNAEIAMRQHVSRQAVDKLVNAAKLRLIDLYLNRFTQLIANKI